jgi:hypothetical protein
VHHAPGVRGGQRGGDLGHDDDRFAPGQRPLPAEPGGDRLAVVELHHHVRHCAVLVQGRVAEVEDAGDVRVAQPGGGQRLLPQPVAEAVVVGELRGQHLDRDGPVQHLVVGAPDDGHAAGAEPFEQAVPVADETALSPGRQPTHVPIVAPGTPRSPGVRETHRE